MEIECKLSFFHSACSSEAAVGLQYTSELQHFLSFFSKEEINTSFHKQTKAFSSNPAAAGQHTRLSWFRKPIEPTHEFCANRKAIKWPNTFIPLTSPSPIGRNAQKWIVNTCWGKKKKRAFFCPLLSVFRPQLKNALERMDFWTFCTWLTAGLVALVQLFPIIMIKWFYIHSGNGHSQILDTHCSQCCTNTLQTNLSLPHLSSSSQHLKKLLKPKAQPETASYRPRVDHTSKWPTARSRAGYQGMHVNTFACDT